MSSDLSYREIPFFNYRKAFVHYEEEFVEIFRDVLHRGAYILQKDLEEFEAHLCDFLGVKHAFGVGNGTDALTIALLAADLKPGDEVLFPSHTMVASAGAIVYAGGVPVPVDIGPDHMMDAADLERAITDKTRAIMPVQLNGRTCNMDAIQAVADKHGLFIVEDAAQALGSQFKGKCAGTFGAAGTFSFYPAKVLGCLGDGGGVVTNDDRVADRICMLRDHGRLHDAEIRTWGMNSRLDNLQAALLDFQLRTYESTMQRRREIAAMYEERLGDLPEVVLPPGPSDDPNHYDVYQNYEIEAERRDDLREFLKANGIGTIIQWSGKAVHQWPGLGFDVHLPKTEVFFTRCMMLPMNMVLSNEDVEYICSKILAFYGK